MAIPKQARPMCLVFFLMIQAMVTHAQKAADSLKHFYKVNHDVFINDFDRQHIPLDGEQVKMIPYRQGPHFGFVDKISGKELVPPKFKNVFAVYAEGAIVEHEGEEGYGLIDEKGEFLIPPVYLNLLKEGDIYHGINGSTDMEENSELPSGNRYFISNTYYDKTGKVLFKEIAHDQISFNSTDTLAWFRYGTRYRIRGKSGKLWQEFRLIKGRNFIGIFDNLLVFHEYKNNTVSYTAYNASNQLQFSLPLKGASVMALYRLGNNLFVYSNDGGYFFSDADGNKKTYGINFSADGFGYSLLFSKYLANDYIMVADFETELMGFVDRKKGELVIPCKYKYVGDFIDGLAPFSLPGPKDAIGFMNTKGKVVIKPSISTLNWERQQLLTHEFGFFEGLCLVKEISMEKLKKNSSSWPGEDDIYKFFYINKNGKKMLQLPDDISMAGKFKDGLAPIEKNNRCIGFIDKKGQMIIPCKYRIVIGGSNIIQHYIIPKFINGFAYIKAFNGYIDKNGKEYFTEGR